jgi:hypothetical protein
MGIRFNCPNGHKLNVKEFLAGKRGVCPQCAAKFIIPMPGEVSVIETPLPVGVAQSQSIEIAIPPARADQGTIASASPSVIIPTTELELSTRETEVRPTIRGSQVPATSVLPESIVAVTSPNVTKPIDVPPVSASSSDRDRSRRNQILVSLLLLALVVLLAGVLIGVLQREVNQAPVEKESTVNREELGQAFAMRSRESPITMHPRDGALKS